MRRSCRASIAFLLALAVAAWAAEKVAFRTSVTAASGKERRGSISVTVIPSKGVHVSSGGTPMTIKVTGMKDLKAPVKVKIAVSYVFCEEKSDTCDFATKTLTVSIPKPTGK